jgi:hypothetical protein
MHCIAVALYDIPAHNVCGMWEEIEIPDGLSMRVGAYNILNVLRSRVMLS